MDRNRVACQCAQRGVRDAFRPEHFVYDEQNDTYICPEEKTLRYNGREKLIGRTRHIYRARRRDCSFCPHKRRCCPGKTNRRSVVRRVPDPAVVSFMEKMKTEGAKKIYKQRSAIAEFSHAWIKQKIGLRQFRLRWLFKVGMETIWVCLT